jgi:two-component system, chemotaxis family, sensor kinase CheA
MSGQFNESVLEMYIFETAQMIGQLEQSLMAVERSGLTPDLINGIFRAMHTIKGSSSMMFFNHIVSLSHTMEDLFYFLRENNPEDIDISALCDLVFEGIDIMKVELEKIKNGDEADGDTAQLVGKIQDYLGALQMPEVRAAPAKQAAYQAVIHFTDGCEMENVRAFTVIHKLKEITEEYLIYPEDILENDQAVQVIRDRGFFIHFKTESALEDLRQFFLQIAYLKDLQLSAIDENEYGRLGDAEDIGPNESLPEATNDNAMESINRNLAAQKKPEAQQAAPSALGGAIQQSVINVNVAKLDKLMDLVGELVISEAMVTQNPDLKGLELENFHKAARQLRKISGELQDLVMSIRMVPLSATFHKMYRLVRDMSKKLDKEVDLQIAGEETEVDKNIIEHISDPLMHLIRNCMDHGLETAEERAEAGKPSTGTVTLEAKNAGSDVLILVRDDGKGLNKEKILRTASENGLLHKPESEMTEKEVHSLIFLPGFSTKDSVTEYSGRGVGMDVVAKNIASVGGSVSVDSAIGEGTTFTIRIPLTLAIIAGMNIRVGSSRYTIPTTMIRESFRAKESDVIRDPEGNEMIMVRGQCYPILRIHERFKVDTEVLAIPEGIITMVEHEGGTLCLFADELLGEQQVVVKALPAYIKNMRRIRGLAGCTLLGDGSISLILDIAGLVKLVRN